MKQINILIIFVLLFISCFTFGQYTDQNPNYQHVAEKYYALADSFTTLQSATIQRTYKAYDWYEAKMQARAERRAFRRQIRLIQAQNTQYYYDNSYPYFGYYNYPFFSSSYYDNGYPYYYRNSVRNIVPPLAGTLAGAAVGIGLYNLLR